MCKTIRVSSPRWILAFCAASVLLHPWLSPLTPAHAASARTEAGVVGTLLPVSRVQSVMLALQNNMDLKVERLNPLIREEEVRRETGAFFSPRLGVESSTDRSLWVAGSVLAGAQVTG